MSVDYIEKNSSDTAVPKPHVEVTDLTSEAEKSWPAISNGVVGKGHLKRPAANSAPGSVSPGTGGTNPRRSQATRSVNSTPDSAVTASSVINPRTDGDTSSDWTIKRNGKNVSPNSVTNTTTPMRLNKSGYPVIVKAPVTGKRGKNSALFGSIIPSTTSNIFQSIATDSSATMDQ